MSLVFNDKYYIPFNKSQITDLPLDRMKPYEISLYSIEKNFIINGKIVKKVELYPIIEFQDKDKEKIEKLNYSKNYIPFKKGYLELNNECYCFQRNKINLIILMLNNEIKINDMDKLLFYIINNCHNKKNYISITIIICTLDFCEFRPFFLLHDKPYHFYDDYVSKNKEEYDKFIKNKNTIYKTYTINLSDINKFRIFEEEDLNIYPTTLPQFIIYDKNYRILYKDNMFQETPENLEEICKNIYDKIENPYNEKNFKPLMKFCPIKVKSFFDKFEKNIFNNEVFNNEKEFIEEKDKLLNIITNETKKEENIGKSCRAYFIIKYQSLTKQQLESISDSKIKEISNLKNVKSIYLKPIISINNENALLSPFMKDRDIIFPKKFRNNMNLLLHFTWKCILSFCANNNVKINEIQFKTKKSFTNLNFTSRKELNVIYQNGLDFYYIPMNFITLFMDKKKFFNIYLKPDLIVNRNFKVKYKDLNSNEKIIEVKMNEITVFQYFRENVYYEQSNFGEVIKKLREENPKVKIKYYLIILTAGDHFKNSIFYDKVKNYLEKFTYVEDVLSFSYIIDEFHELTKYGATRRNIYIFGLHNEKVNIELIPDKIEKSKELLIYHINKLLLKFYEKRINKKQYKLLKQTWKDFLNIKEHNNDKTLFEIELSKIKYFDNKETQYNFKCYNHEKKIWDDNKGDNIKELKDLKMKINQILEQAD